MSADKNKVLRIGVIQRGQIKEERLVKKREDVTVGKSSGNTFVLDGKKIPDSFTLFAMKGSQYSLNFTDEMQGRVSVNNSNVDFDSLKNQALVKKSGNTYALPLTAQSRGKISFDDEITILFQFVTPPPEPTKLAISSHASSYWLKNLTGDATFTTVFLSSFFLHFSIVWYLSVIPYPKDVEFDKIPDRFAKILMPKMDEKKEEKVEEAPVEDTKTETKKDDTDKGEEMDAEERMAQARAKGPSKEAMSKAAGAGILKILTVDGPGGGSALANVFAEGSVAGDLDSAMAGIGGIGVATSDDVRSTFGGGGTGQAATIDDLGTKGGREAAKDLGKGKGATVSGRIQSGTLEVDGNLSSEVIAKTVRSRITAIRNCYEAALKRDPKLKGRIVITFTIGSNGRVKSLEVESSTISDPSVADCIISRMRMWSFPKPDGGDVTASYPFIFSPAS